MSTVIYPSEGDVDIEGYDTPISDDKQEEIFISAILFSISD